MFMPARGPLAAYDETPPSGPITRAGYEAAMQFLKGKLPEADRQEFGRLVEKRMLDKSVAAEDVGAEEELRRRKLSEALSALQQFAVEKLQDEDRPRFDQLLEELLGAGPMASDPDRAGATGGGAASPLDEMTREREAKADVPANGLRRGNGGQAAMDAAVNGDFDKRFPDANRITNEYFRR
jgi:hypothetical protein